MFSVHHWKAHGKVNQLMQLKRLQFFLCIEGIKTLNKNRSWNYKNLDLFVFLDSARMLLMPQLLWKRGTYHLPYPQSNNNNNNIYVGDRLKGLPASMQRRPFQCFMFFFSFQASSIFCLLLSLLPPPPITSVLAITKSQCVWDSASKWWFSSHFPYRNPWLSKWRLRLRPPFWGDFWNRDTDYFPFLNYYIFEMGK